MEAAKKNYGNQHVNPTPIGVHTPKARNDTWTDAQTSNKEGDGMQALTTWNYVAFSLMKIRRD